MEKMSWCDNLEVTVKYRMQISQTCVNLTTIRVEQFHDPVLTDLTHFFFFFREATPHGVEEAGSRRK